MVLPVNVDAKVIRTVDCGPGKEKNEKRRIIDDAVVRVRDERIPMDDFHHIYKIMRSNKISDLRSFLRVHIRK
jgi:hypothetical protein